MASTPLKTTPVKPLYCDPDHCVIKLKYEKWEEFTELVISHITRVLDLPGTQLEVLRGQDESVLRDHSNKLNQSAKKSWNPLKKKDSKNVGCVLTEEQISQIQQLTDFLGDCLTVEGLFRKPGNSVRQSQLLTALNTGVYINFEKSQFQAHDAASVLKTILGQLSEPLLLPSRHFDAHVQISNMNRTDPESNNKTVPDKGKRIEALQLLLLLLPTNHRKVLRGIFDLLYQTARHQSENKMNAANLSAMFAPHLIWPRSAKASDIHESVAGLNDHVAFMIRHSQKIFRAPVYIRDAANLYYPAPEVSSMMSPKVSTSLLVAPSSAVKRTASERQKYSDRARAQTETAINDLYDQVNNLPNSSKKKKMVKNFSKHQEVLKYQNKSRKRNRTLSGMLRRKSANASRCKAKQSYQHFPQPGDDNLPQTSKFNFLPKPDLLNDCKAETVSLNAEINDKPSTKSVSHVSLPERITRSCHFDGKSPRLTAISKQIRFLQHRKSASPSVKINKPESASKEGKENFIKPVKVSTV